MKKWAKIILLVFIISISYTTKAYCFLDWITDGIKLLTGGANQVYNGAKEAFGWGQTSKDIGKLVANYNDADLFIKQSQKFGNDPKKAMEEFYNQFAKEVSIPGPDLYEDVLQSARQQDGEITSARKETMAYLKKNMDFADVFKKKNEVYKQRIETAATASMATEEQKRAAHEKIMEELALDQSQLLQKLYEIETKRLTNDAVREGKDKKEVEQWQKDYKEYMANLKEYREKTGQGSPGGLKAGSTGKTNEDLLQQKAKNLFGGKQ